VGCRNSQKNKPPSLCKICIIHEDSILQGCSY
jgi:uncharacterized protein (UPF0305 family)